MASHHPRPMVSRLVVEAMLKEAAEAISRHSAMLAQVGRDGESLIIELDDKPHTQLTLTIGGG